MRSFIKKTLAVLLSAMLLLSAVPITAMAAETTAQECVGASSGTTGDCTWTLDDDGLLTISGNGAMADYGFCGPWGDKIKNVVIESGVTAIGKEAFSGCTSLVSVTIGDSVTSIGNFAFRYCTSLVGVTIPDSVTSIGTGAFHGCSRLASVTISDSVTTIDVGAFHGCTSLESVTIGDSVTTIGDFAFFGCTSLASVTIPDSVTSIGAGAFEVCAGLESLTVDANNTVYDSRNNCNAVIETGSNTLIAGCKNTVIPNDVTTVGEDAFFGCTSLTSVTIPDSVTSIGDFAFCGCTSLASVTIPDSVTSIGFEAFGYLNYGSKAEGFTIYGKPGSEAEAYANENGGFIFISDEYTVTTGDVNGDSKVDITDATLVQQFAAELIELDENQKKAADTNKDGKVDIDDATLIQKFVAELIKSFD